MPGARAHFLYGSVSHVAEIAVTLHAKAIRFARAGDKQRAQRCYQAAQLYRDLSDPVSGYSVRVSASTELLPDPRALSSERSRGNWFEGSQAVYPFSVLHDLKGTIAHVGAFASKSAFE